MNELRVSLARNGTGDNDVPLSLLGLSFEVVAKLEILALEKLDAIIQNLQILCSRVAVEEPHQNRGYTVPTTTNAGFDFSHVKPSLVSAIILDGILASISAEPSNLSTSATSTLLEVFVQTAEPTWAEIGAWMSVGMDFSNSISETHNDERATGSLAEFFIQRNWSIPPGTVEYWLEGYKIEHSNSPSMVPALVGAFAEDILSAGKAVGLLRVLQIDDFFPDTFTTSDESASDDSDSDSPHSWLQTWPTFRQLLHSEEVILPAPVRLGLEVASERAHNEMFHGESPLMLVSEGGVSSLVRERLLPFCLVAHSRLNRVVINDCRLWYHLDTITGLFFMRNGDTMGAFCEAIFERVSLAKSRRQLVTRSSVKPALRSAASSPGATTIL